VIVRHYNGGLLFHLFGDDYTFEKHVFCFSFTEVRTITAGLHRKHLLWYRRRNDRIQRDADFLRINGEVVGIEPMMFFFSNICVAIC